MYAAIVEACTLARTAPAGPVVVEVPANLYLVPGEYQENKFKYKDPHIVQVHERQLQDAIERLNRSESIGIYCGLGAQNASAALIDLAERLDAIVFSTISGKGVFPENNSRFVWNSMGRALPPQLQKLDQSIDCLLAIGCRFSEVSTASYGFKTPLELIHVDVDENVFSKNYKASLEVVSDANAFVQALLQSKDLKKRSTNVDRLQALSKVLIEIKQELKNGGDATKVDFSILAENISKTCGDNTVYVTDSGNGTFMGMEILRLKGPNRFLAPVDFSCMGYSVPASIGAKLACPTRPVVTLAGDGAFLMTGLELATAVTYKAGVICMVLRDGELSQIAQFQRASLNRESCTEVSEYGLENFAKALEFKFYKINRNEDCAQVIAAAHEETKTGAPVLVEVNIDYSKASYFSKGVIKTNFLRFGWRDRIRLVSRVIGRKVF